MELNKEQRAAVEHGEGPLVVVAGAGTGKTRVIVEKVGYLLRNPRLEPESILALTFTNKAAAEMRRRIVNLLGERGRRCCFSTFHAFCYGLLREELSLRALDKIDQWIFFRRHLEELELDYYLKVSEPGRFLENLVEFCSHCHDNLVSPVMYRLYVEKPMPAGMQTVSPADYRKYVEQLAEEWERSPRQDWEGPEREDEETARLRELARVYERSEELQAREGLLSFGAMISEVVFRLKKSPAWLRQLQRRYAYILVDEYQDTNAAQWELLKLLAGERRNVTVVGDDYQAIYRFRGAADGSLEQFEKEDFAGCQRVGLHRNYRSTKSILRVADAAIAMDEDLYQADKQLTTEKDPGCKVEVWEFADQHHQAEFLAEEMARRVEAGEAYSDFAVLYRAHRHRDRLVQALRRRGIPFAIRNLSINNFLPVRDIVAGLRAIGRPTDSVSLLRLMTHPLWKLDMALVFRLCREAHGRRIGLREITEESLAGSDGKKLSKLIDFLGRYQKIAPEQRLPLWLNQLREELGLFGLAQDSPAWNAFSEFVRCWDREKGPTGLLDEFLEYFAYFEEAGGTINLPEGDDDPLTDRMPPPASAENALSVSRQSTLWEESADSDSKGKVKLMTVHAAKGLEFEHVFLFHLVRRAFPVPNRRPLISLPTVLWKRPVLQGDFHLKEERRLFYVALTRAKSTLTLCTISNDKQQPSLFLEELRDSNRPELEWRKQKAWTVPEQPHLSRQEGSFGSTRLAPSVVAIPESALPSADNLILSVSGLETYLECPAKYYYSYRWRIPVPPAPPLVFGSAMHGAVQEVVRALAPGPGDLSPDALEAILNRHWPAAGFADPLQERKYRAEGLRQLEGVRQAWSQEPFELLYQEKTFEFEWAGTRLVGRMDQINRCSPTEVELIEYKTGRPQTQKEADGSAQLTLYAEACRRVLGLEPRSLVLFNLATGEPVRTTRSPEQFRALEHTIRQTAAAIRAGEFPPQPGYLCRYCDFRPICPAHEETG